MNPDINELSKVLDTLNGNLSTFVEALSKAFNAHALIEAVLFGDRYYKDSSGKARRVPGRKPLLHKGKKYRG